MHTDIPRLAAVEIATWRRRWNGRTSATAAAATVLALAVCAAAATVLLPRGLELQALMAIKDDPTAIAERALDGRFDAAVANREIAAALTAKDVDLAQSFVDLAAAYHVTIDPVLAAKTKAAAEEAASARGKAVSFVRGLITGVPTDGAALAGTAVGDLFVFGDVRDLTREGVHAARGQPVDKLVGGLAAVGVAITAGIYVTLGVTVPALSCGFSAMSGASNAQQALGPHLMASSLCGARPKCRGWRNLPKMKAARRAPF